MAAGKFKPGDEVYCETTKGQWSKAIVECEKFNGGNGGFYTIRYVSNGNTRTVPDKYLSRVSSSTK